MLVCTLVDALENRQIRNNAPGVEVLEAAEDDVIAVVDNLLVVVARVHGAADKVNVLCDKLLRPVFLLIGAHDVGGPGPKKMVTKKHAKGSIAFGDLTDHFVGYFPALLAATILSWAKDSGKTGGFEKGYFCQGGFVRMVSDCGIFG